MEGDYGYSDASDKTDFRHFNPLPPHGGRRYLGSRTWDPAHGPISIHSLRMEGDGDPFENAAASDARDISIHSLRMEGDRPAARRRSISQDIISIHSLRMEGDIRRTMSAAILSPSYFNPLPPHGGRRTAAGRGVMTILGHFNPLPPHGGRLPGAGPVSRLPTNAISIHSLRMEGDLSQSLP